MRVVAVIVAGAGPADAEQIAAIRASMADEDLIVVRAPPRVGDIARRVAQELGVAVCDLVGGSHSKGPSRARFATVWLARSGGRTFAQIGEALGGRHHSSAMHAHRRAEEMRAVDRHSRRPVDPAFRAVTDRLALEFLGDPS